MRSTLILLSIAFSLVGLAIIAAQNLGIALGVIMAILGHHAFVQFMDHFGDDRD